MQDVFDPVTLLILAVAAFVIWRLRSVLGTRTGAEPPPRPRPNGTAGEGPGRFGGNVVPLPGAANDAAPARPAPAAEPAGPAWAGLAEPGTPLADGLDAIRGADRGFDPREFLGGARAAYETIVSAFAAGDRRTLKDLLSKEVAEGFTRAIAEREARGEKVETTFVSIDEAKLLDASLRGTTAQVTARFVSKLVTVTRDRAGAVVDGSPDKIVDVTDVWTFSRDVRSRDPNWLLVATEAAA